jgi:hypothetical protein
MLEMIDYASVFIAARRFPSFLSADDMALLKRLIDNFYLSGDAKVLCAQRVLIRFGAPRRFAADFDAGFA